MCGREVVSWLCAQERLCTRAGPGARSHGPLCASPFPWRPATWRPADRTHAHHNTRTPPRLRATARQANPLCYYYSQCPVSAGTTGTGSSCCGCCVCCGCACCACCGCACCSSTASVSAPGVSATLVMRSAGSPPAGRGRSGAQQATRWAHARGRAPMCKQQCAQEAARAHAKHTHTHTHAARTGACKGHCDARARANRLRVLRPGPCCGCVGRRARGRRCCQVGRVAHCCAQLLQQQLLWRTCTQHGGTVES